MLVRMGRKENPSTLLVGMQIGAATVENGMEVSKKKKKKERKKERKKEKT